MMNNSTSKATVAIVLVGLVLAAAAVIVYMVEIDQTQEAKLPDVNVEVKGGQAPDFKVKTGDVKVGEEDVKVKVPEVDVKMKETEVTVPTITVTPPSETTDTQKTN